MAYLLANLGATAITASIYWLITPRGWNLRTKLDHRAKMIDMAICAGMVVLWGVILTVFIFWLYDTEQANWS